MLETPGRYSIFLLLARFLTGACGRADRQQIDRRLCVYLASLTLYRARNHAPPYEATSRRQETKTGQLAGSRRDHQLPFDVRDLSLGLSKTELGNGVGFSVWVLGRIPAAVAWTQILRGRKPTTDTGLVGSPRCIQRLLRFGGGGPCLEVRADVLLIEVVRRHPKYP